MYTLAVYTLTWLMCMFCSISAFYAAYLADILKSNFLKLQLLREILLEAIALSSTNSIVYYCFSKGLTSKNKHHANIIPGVDFKL